MLRARRFEGRVAWHGPVVAVASTKVRFPTSRITPRPRLYFFVFVVASLDKQAEKFDEAVLDGAFAPQRLGTTRAGEERRANVTAVELDGHVGAVTVAGVDLDDIDVEIF